MTELPSTQSPANDNRHLRPIADPFDREIIATRLDGVLNDLACEGASDTVLIEVLFKSMTELAYRPHPGQLDHPTSPGASERHNQLSRISGELEALKAVLMQDWLDRLLDG